MRNRYIPTAVSKKKVAESLAGEISDEEGAVVEKKTRRTTKRAPARSRKKVVAETPADNFVLAKNGDITDDEAITPPGSTEDTKKPRRQTRRKGTFLVVVDETKNFAAIRYNLCSFVR